MITMKLVGECWRGPNILCLDNHGGWDPNSGREIDLHLTYRSDRPDYKRIDEQNGHCVTNMGLFDSDRMVISD